MDYAGIRKSLKLTQLEMAALLVLSAQNIRNWEQGVREPDSAAKTLYELVESKNAEVLFLLATIAAKKKCKTIEEVKALLSVISKVVKDKLPRVMLQAAVIKYNRKWKPEKLVTE
jgi:transcriptional regulator with XRE-family HTH domain